MSTFDALQKLTKRDNRRDFFRFPDLSHRITLNGRTGSGKTQFGAWLLSNARFDLQPFVILNFKDEKLFHQIERARPLDYSDAIPDKPGLYHLAAPGVDPDLIEKWLWKLWNKANTGLFVDEAYLMPDHQAYKAILTTGRSRHIPTYSLSQRPVAIPRFVISEADFYISFNLNDKSDEERIREFTPGDHDTYLINRETKRLPRLSPYHSRWYDIGNDFSCVLGPCPDTNAILEKFERRLTPRQRMI